MALTNEDLMAISNLMDQKILPINNRLDRMDSRLDRMESRMDCMENRMDRMESRMDRMESRIDRMESRLDRLESDISAMKVGQAELSRQIKEIDQKVSNAYQLALDAWGTGVENRNWLEADRLNA